MPPRPAARDVPPFTNTQDLTLLTTKLYMPPSRPNLVPRPRLIQRLGDGLRLGCKLTLVSAPAGFGKTTLLTEWLCGVECPRAWLSLDQGDNDPFRFLTYLVAALQRIDPSIGQTAQAILQSPQPPPPESLLASLINDMAATSQPFVLVLDDYHLIHMLAIHEQLAFLLEHQPPYTHLVIAGREDPPLPLSRLRARGQVADIRQADLKFTPEEAADFLRQTTQLEISPAQVSALHRRTEGWAAGLQLAALSLRGSDDRQRVVESFTGSQRYVLDYLIEEVLQWQPPDIQEFLLKTSILDRFCAPLCDTVVEREDSRSVLLRLDQANLFVIPLDETREWYRYHRLFADLLRHRLEMETVQPALVSLHQRASQWYQAEGYLSDAVIHALAASDWDSATRLILSTSTRLLQRGEVVTLLNWFQALPDDVVRADPRLCCDYSWPLILTDQLEAAESYLALAEQAAQEYTSLPGSIAAARAHIARSRGDHRRALELSERALSLLPQDDASSRSVVGLNLGIAHWSAGRLDQAERALIEAGRAASGSGNDYVGTTAIVLLGRIQAARARLRQAAGYYHQAIEQGGRLPITALCHISLAQLLYQWNDLDSAADHLRQGLELSQLSGGVEFQATAYFALAQLKQARGEGSEAQQALQAGRELIEHPGLSPSGRLHAQASGVLIALAQGDVEEASHLAEGLPSKEEVESVSDILLLTVAQARLLLARGQKATVGGQLEARYAMASRADWGSALIETHALQALAAPTPEEGLAPLTEALTLAEPEGYVRTFVDLGEPMARLLRQAASHGVLPIYVEALLAAFHGGLLDDGGKAKSDPSAGAERSASPSSWPSSRLVEPLSHRELEVLGLLVEGQTYQEIALTLYLSINTVKTHLKNVYGKLGVSNRRQAIAKAKELDLLR